MRGKSPNPAEQVGVFKTLSEVPTRHRLRTYSASYEGRDVWAEFVEESGRKEEDSQANLEHCERTERYWKEYMDGTDRHHALATPADVEGFCEWLFTRGRSMKPMTLYSNYWRFIENFFGWLQWSTEHPHNYHVALMAVIENPEGAVGEVWDEKYKKWDHKHDFGFEDSVDGGLNWRRALRESLSERGERNE